MNINNLQDLELAIVELEKRKVIQESLLKSQFQAAKDSLKPINLIKNGFKSITNTPEIRDSAIKTITGIGLGLLSKNLFIGKAVPVIKTLISGAIETGVHKSLETGSNTVKAYGTAILNNLFKKKENKHLTQPS